MTEAIQEVIFPAIGLVFLLLGIVLLVSILFSAFNPYDQIAFINAEKLRSKIDEVCMNSGGETLLMSFELKQNTPSFTWLFTILPRWLIRSGGDPNYVLYYESFPPGEGVGWEVYQDLQSRLITPVPENFLSSQNPPNNGQSVSTYAESVRNSYAMHGTNKVDSVIVNNIILNEGFRADYRKDKNSISPTSASWIGGPVNEAKGKDKFFSYGSWKNSNMDSKQSEGGDDVFVFSNYMSLSPSEKAAIKYMPCGVNSLCLKTRSGVYSFPLHQCNDIKNIQVVYDKRSITTVGDVVAVGTATVVTSVVLAKVFVAVSKISGIAAIVGTGIVVEEAFNALVNGFLSYKKSDLAISSPCKISMDPSETECGLGNIYPGNIVIEKGSCNDAKFKCENVISYPIYEYNAKTGFLDNAKRADKTNAIHYSCIEKVNDKTGHPQSSSYGPSDECIHITLTDIKAEGFCWTPDPYGADSRITKAASDALNFAPIVHSLSYFDASGNPVLVLNPSEIKEMDTFVQRWEKQLSWGWPGTT